MNINFHAVSEHTFRGMHKPLEIHLVHKRSDSDALLVVAIPVESPTPIGGPGGGLANKPQFLQRSNRSLARQPVAHGEVFGGNTVNLVNTGQGPSPAPMPDKEGPGPYKVPDASLPKHNPTLQAFLRKAPPFPGASVKAQVNELTPMDINTLVQGGTFMEYAGSLTAPPCSEIVTWFVRRDPLMASDEQVLILHDDLYASSSAFGNYRTTMPLQNRPIGIRQAVKEEPPLTAPEMAIPLGPNPRTDREFRAMKWAKDALAIAQHSQNYVRDLDTRLRNAAVAHANALAPDLMPEHVKAGAPPPPVNEPSVEPVDIAKVADSMSKSIATAAKEAIADATNQISIEARAAAMAAAKEATALAAGAMPAIPGAPGAAPAAAMR